MTERTRGRDRHTVCTLMLEIKKKKQGLERYKKVYNAHTRNGGAGRQLLAVYKPQGWWFAFRALAIAGPKPE